MPRAVTITIPIDNAGKISRQSIVVPTELEMDGVAIQAILDEKVANGSIRFISYSADSQELSYQLKLGNSLTTTICVRFAGWDPNAEAISRNFNPPMIEHVLQIKASKPRATLRPD